MLVDPKMMRYGAALSSAVLTKAALLYGAYRLGTYLDTRWGSTPFVMVGLLTVAAGLGIWWILFVAERNKA